MLCVWPRPAPLWPSPHSQTLWHSMLCLPSPPASCVVLKRIKILFFIFSLLFLRGAQTLAHFLVPKSFYGFNSPTPWSIISRLCLLICHACDIFHITQPSAPTPHTSFTHVRPLVAQISAGWSGAERRRERQAPDSAQHKVTKRCQSKDRSSVSRHHRRVARRPSYPGCSPGRGNFWRDDD